MRHMLAHLAALLPDFEIENTGGNVFVLVHYSSAGPVIGVSEDCVCIYPSAAAWNGDDEDGREGERINDRDFDTGVEALSFVIQALIRISNPKEDS